MKRVFYVVLSLALTVALFGCGAKEKEVVEKETNVVEEKEDEVVGKGTIELADFGYKVVKGSNDYVVYYSVELRNTSKDSYLEFPTYQIIAEDKDGVVLDTFEHTIGYIDPDRTSGWASQAMILDEEPAKVYCEVSNGQDYNWHKGRKGEMGLSAEGLNIKKDDYYSKVTGKIKNISNNDYDEIAVIIMFRDDNGKLSGGEVNFVDNVKANGTTAFSMDIVRTELVTDNYDVYFLYWGIDGFESDLDDATLDKISVRVENKEVKTETDQKETKKEEVKEKKSSSIYEYAFVRKLTEYDIYLVFDLDGGVCRNFSTSDTGVLVGTLRGNLDDGITITFDYYGDVWEETFKFDTTGKSKKGVLIDRDGFDWDYELTDVKSAEKILNQSGYHDMK